MNTIPLPLALWQVCIDMRTMVAAILLTGFTMNSYGQTAQIKIARVFRPNSFERFNEIKFQFNETAFLATDTSTKVISLAQGLDRCQAIIGTDTIQFYARFKADHEYIIKPGCCCAAFTLEPKDNPRRGVVYFQNHTKRDLGLIVAESNTDTVAANEDGSLFSSESAMCLFKPCSIEIVEPDYFSDKYHYLNDDRNYDSLWNEQSQFVLAKSRFHFLHGEKVQVHYDEKAQTTSLELMGYLTDAEYEAVRR